MSLFNEVLYKNIKKNLPKTEKYLTEANLMEFLNTPQEDLKNIILVLVQ